MQASPWILPAAIVGAGLVGLTVVSHGRGAAALVGQMRSSAMLEAIAPAAAKVRQGQWRRALPRRRPCPRTLGADLASSNWRTLPTHRLGDADKPQHCQTFGDQS
jgi:hypothetical protein